jgi:hypothetical protein
MRKFYSKLPLIRELKEVIQLLAAIQRNISKIEGNSITLDALAKDMTIHHLMSLPRYQDAKRLFLHDGQAFSQHGEDGAIAEIFRRVGTDTKKFLEIGVGDGLENNSAYLLTQDWSGFWVEADAGQVERIKNNCRHFIASGALKVIHEMAQETSLRQTLEKIGVPKNLDFLSLDIDRDTFWLWSWVSFLQPRVVVIEYNASFPPDVDWKMDYEPGTFWNGTNYFGASLKAFEKFGRELGYSIVGCDVSGTNAYFVRTDLCSDKFCEPFTSENHYEPARYYLHHRWGGNHPRGLVK